MDRDEKHEREIKLDLSKLLGFQGLAAPADDADLAETMSLTHNKIGEVPPNGYGDGDGDNQT